MASRKGKVLVMNVIRHDSAPQEQLSWENVSTSEFFISLLVAIAVGRLDKFARKEVDQFILGVITILAEYCCSILRAGLTVEQNACARLNTGKGIGPTQTHIFLLVSCLRGHREERFSLLTQCLQLVELSQHGYQERGGHDICVLTQHQSDPT